MAFINVAEWSPHHVVQWLQGLDDCVLPYANFFLERQINGCRLLMLNPDDLEKMNIMKIGHQELILDAIDLLRHLHYGFSTETLQTLVLRLGCKSRSLYNYLRKESDCGQCTSCVYNRQHEEERQQQINETNRDQLYNGGNSNSSNNNHHHHHTALSSGAERLERLEPLFIRRACRKISTNTLSGVCDILVSVKHFISWIDKYPFEGQDYYIPIRKTVLAISIELASTAQRDHFVESPKEIIKSNCLTFAEICDRIVQELNDSLAIQPAVLEMVPIKKRAEEDFGMHIISSYAGIHTIAYIKIQSPTHRCGRVEENDEIVQINYQTVVGWQFSKLIEAMKEYSTEMLLTIKKRPRHSLIIGQIDLVKIYKIPQRKICVSAANSGNYFRESTGDYGRKAPFSTQPCNVQNRQRTGIDANIKLETSDFLEQHHLPLDQSVCIEDHDNNICEHNNNENKQLIEKISLEKPMKGPVYQLLAKPKRLRRRATISGSSPTTICPPIFFPIEDLVNLEQKSSKRLAGLRKSADPRMTTEHRASDNIVRNFNRAMESEFYDHSELEKRMLSSKSGDESAANEDNVHPEVLKKRKEMILRTYSDDVNTQNPKKRINQNTSCKNSPEAKSNFKLKDLSVKSEKDQVTCTIVDVGSGEQQVQRKVGFCDEKINRIMVKHENVVSSDRFSSDYLTKRADAQGWIEFLDTPTLQNITESELEQGFNWKHYFYILINDSLYFFLNEHRPSPDKCINLNSISYLGEMNWYSSNRWWFKMRGNSFDFFLGSKVEALLRSLLTRLKSLQRSKLLHDQGTDQNDCNLANQNQMPNDFDQSNSIKKNKKISTQNLVTQSSSRLPKLFSSSSAQSTPTNRSKSKFYLEQQSEDSNNYDMESPENKVLTLKPVPTPKPRLSKLKEPSPILTQTNPVAANASFSTNDHQYPEQTPESQRFNAFHQSSLELIAPPKPARAHEESTFYTSLNSSLSLSKTPNSGGQIKCATSDEIQSIYTQRNLIPTGGGTTMKSMKITSNNSKLDHSHSPVSDHSLSSSSGISSYYSSTGTGGGTVCNNVESRFLSSYSPMNVSGGSNHGDTLFSTYPDLLRRNSHTNSMHGMTDEDSSEHTLTVAPPSPQRKSSFRLFGSPKVLRKFTSSSKGVKDKTTSETKESSNNCSSNVKLPTPTSSERDAKPAKGGGKLFLNSPRLTRAFFGSRRGANTSKQTELEKCSAACQTDESLMLNRSISENSISNLLSLSSLTDRQTACGATSMSFQHGPQSICTGNSFSASTSIDVPPTPETSRKPTMGVSMLSKRRTSSVSVDRAAIESALFLHAAGGTDKFVDHSKPT